MPFGRNDSDDIFIKTSRLAFTDRSGETSSTAGTSTEAVPANAARQYLFIQNIGTQTLWINFTSAATRGSGSIQLAIGESFVLEGTVVTSEAVNVVSGGASISYTVKEA